MNRLFPSLIMAFTAVAFGQTMESVWVSRYCGTGSGFGRAVAVDEEGNIFAAGEASGLGSTHCYLAKYVATDGELLWEVRSHGISRSRAWPIAIALDTHGGVAMAGTITDKGGGFEKEKGSYDFYIARHSAKDGHLLWEQRYDGAGHGSDIVTAAAVDARGDVFVAGYSEGPNHRQEDLLVVKYAAEDGRFLWEQRIDGGPGIQEFGRALAIDAAGNVIVTGSRAKPGGGSFSGATYVAKFAGSSGEIMWEKRVEEGRAARLGAVNLDSRGDILVAGTMGDFPGGPGSVQVAGRGFYAAKYAGTDGALRWEWMAPKDTAGFGTADAIAVDRDGCAIVTGMLWRSDKVQDLYTAKLAGADGSLLWDVTCAGRGRDYAQAVAADSHGDVFIAGTATNEEGMGDIYIARYAAADGKVTWEHRCLGARRKTHRSSFIGMPSAVGGLALTPRGGVVVVGFSRSTDQRDNCMATFLYEPTGTPAMARPSRVLTTIGTQTPKGTTVTYQSPNAAPRPGSVPASPPLVPPRLAAHAAWRQNYFGAYANDSEISGDGADPNQNGIVNSLEYALGGDPLGTDGVAILPQLSIDADGRACLSFHRYASRDDLTLMVTAADMPAGPWIELARSTLGGPFAAMVIDAVVEESGEDDERTVIVRDAFVIGDAAHPQRFLRLEVVR